jgi:Fur family ferric uptake transcriptional regulator
MKAMPKQRQTKQRQVILEELRTFGSHPTAAELYHVVRKRLPKVSLGTVYRNLELLARNRTIRKLDMGGPEARFDGVTKPHHHARCTECGTLDDLYDVPDDIVPQEIMNLDAYDLRGYRIEFFGVCPECKSRREAGGHHHVH